MDDIWKRALSSLEASCVKREYCESDILKKALTLTEGNAEAAEMLVRKLVDDKFVDNFRYASAFAREKAQLTGWGCIKISYALRMKGIDKETIDAALAEVEPGKSLSRLEKLLRAKAHALQGDPEIKFKLLRFALGRGYSYEEVSPLVSEVLSEF